MHTMASSFGLSTTIMNKTKAGIRGRSELQAGSDAFPADLGFSMPAEWEQHHATWIGWPHNRTDWPGKMGAITWVYAEIARKISQGESLKILVDSPEHQTRARRVLDRSGVDLSRIEFVRFPTDRGWTRDFGPFFVRSNKPRPQIAISRFGFNAWAKYKDWRKDCRIPQRVASRFGYRMLEARRDEHLVVLEGGAIDVNGRGTLITTEECLLDQAVQTRNPGLSRQDLEKVLRDFLGATNVLWLGNGIAGDDTHGHVDDLCRFVGPTTVVLCQEQNSSDENYVALQENRERVEGMRLETGEKLEVVPIPMPSPLFMEGRRLPASYANFYISNACVLVPTFNDAHDRIALGILAELFSDRPVIGLHAVDLVWGLGTVHCLTQQQPSVR
jgi:agmatine deiminase